MSRPPRDLTPLPDLSYGAALAGPVRTRRPVYGDLLPPLNAGCPAGENIQAWLASSRVGEHERAWRQLVADNPLPAIHGRVCYHLCESACNRAELDSAVSIHSTADASTDRHFRPLTVRLRRTRLRPAGQPLGCHGSTRSSGGRRAVA